MILFLKEDVFIFKARQQNKEVDMKGMTELRTVPVSEFLLLLLVDDSGDDDLLLFTDRHRGHQDKKST